MNNFKSFPEKPIKSPFGTPKGYFDTLSEKILCQVETYHEVKVIPFYSKLKYQLLAVASVIILLIGIIWVVKKQDQLNFNQNQIEYYLSYEQHLNTYDLLSLMEEDFTMNDNKINTASDIEWYLLKNNDIELLMEIDEQP